MLCKLGVWFCVGMCECFCGGRLKVNQAEVVFALCAVLLM